MRREFHELQSAADAKTHALEKELGEGKLACDNLKVESEFWKEQVQRMLRAQGLTEIPRDIAAAANDQNDVGAERGSIASLETPASAGQEVSSERIAAHAEHDRVVQKHASQQKEYDALEQQFDELSRRSDEAMGQADLQKQREKELEITLAAAEADAAERVSTANAASKQAQAASEAKVEAEQKVRLEQQAARETRLAGREDSAGEAADLRQQLGALRAKASALKSENATLEGRLRKHRAAAAADQLVDKGR